MGAIPLNLLLMYFCPLTQNACSPGTHIPVASGTWAASSLVHFIYMEAPRVENAIKGVYTA